MAKNDNLTDFLADVADAIRSKKGISNPINPQDFSAEINSIEGGGTSTPSRPTWTGHADAEGLRAIGWTDEDIAYYQEHGVNWNEEDDEYHKVSDGNKALYGVLTASNISTYKDRIVYLPKIDTSSVTSMYKKFENCYSLVAIPLLDTSKVTNMYYMFSNCYSLTAIPLLDTSNVTNMAKMFGNCSSLTAIPLLDTSKVTSMESMFSNCHSLTAIPLLDTSKVTSMIYMLDNCYTLVAVPLLNKYKVTSADNMLRKCYSLRFANLNNVKLYLNLGDSSLLSKESLLYIINNEAATSAITIKLASYAYERLVTDSDIVAALTSHPNISLAK